jgi:hypothetical protein
MKMLARFGGFHQWRRLENLWWFLPLLLGTLVSICHGACTGDISVSEFTFLVGLYVV